MTASSKDFGPIRDDYTFFEDHSTEAEQDALAYAPHVRRFTEAGSGPIRMLDFGCGEGRFTAYFLKTSGLPADRLSLSLVEPDEVYLQQAVERLTPLSTQSISAWPALPANLESCFDFVLSNHVFYYVVNLDETLAAIYRSLAPNGLFLAAIAGKRNAIIEFWNVGFGRLGKPYPFNTAEDFEAALVRQGLDYTVDDVHYELAFPDSEENRLKIVRFVMGSHLAEVSQQDMLDVFDTYVEGDEVVMRIVHEYFLIRRGEEEMNR